jgi:hypothetical protein
MLCAYILGNPYNIILCNCIDNVGLLYILFGEQSIPNPISSIDECSIYITLVHVDDVLVCQK